MTKMSLQVDITITNIHATNIRAEKYESNTELRKIYLQ